MKRALALILALVMVMALVACGGNKSTSSTSTPGTSTPGTSNPSTSNPSTSNPSTPEPVTPAEPKILKMYLTTAPANAWSPASNTAASSDIQKLVSGTLYKTLPVDGKAVLSPVLADSEPVDVNGDGLTWNIAISPDAKWENGEQINADTFLYTFKMVLDPKLVFSNASTAGTNHLTIVNAAEYYGQGKEGAAAVAWEDVGFKKVDEMTIQVTVTTPVNATLVMRHFSNSTTAPVYQPLFEQCLSADGASSTYGSAQDKIISSGAFKASNWVDGAAYEFVKNENFARADLVKLDGMTYTVVEDTGTRLQLFEKGELDYITLDTAALDTYGDDPRIMSIPGRRVYSIEFCSTSTEKPIISNENFRLALFYATNRAELGKLIGQDPATGLLSPTAIATADGTSLRQLAAAKGYEAANNGYDPTLAKQYFETALKEESLTSVELTVLCNSTMTNRCEYLQENWQTVFGADKFKLNIDSQPSAQAGELRRGWKTNPNSYELTFTQWNLTSGDWDPITGLRAYTTTYSTRNAPYDDPTVNALYAEANSAENRLNMDKRNELAMEIEKYLLEHAVVIPLTYETTYCMAADRVILPLEEYDSELGFGWYYCEIEQ